MNTELAYVHEPINYRIVEEGIDDENVCLNVITKASKILNDAFHKNKRAKCYS